jgi:hypothetical protein
VLAVVIAPAAIALLVLSLVWFVRSLRKKPRAPAATA